MIILVLVLRYSITKLRELGLSNILPLDHNIYLHKVVGYLIFFQSLFHTVMHLLNFWINVQPDPYVLLLLYVHKSVLLEYFAMFLFKLNEFIEFLLYRVRFVQLTSQYWEYLGPKQPGFANLGYNPPPNCTIADASSGCPPESLDPSLNVTQCQLCDTDNGGRPWSFYEWLFTMEPKILGLIPGMANVTGITLIILLTLMVVCSMPFVRRGGYFEVFYFSHLLYIGYWGLLILHAPEFWKWFIAPGIIFLLELSYRQMTSWMGKGKTSISAGVVLPSKVTNLIVKRPHNFNFAPGDWVFVKIPAIAKFEWHPFTISSAPEQQDFFTLHIRGVGQWTNRLYQYFEEEYRRQNEGVKEEKSGIDRLRG